MDTNTGGVFQRCQSPLGLMVRVVGQRRVANGDLIHTFRAVGGKALFERTYRMQPPPGEAPAIWERRTEEPAAPTSEATS